MAKAKRVRIDARKKEAENRAQQLGHILGKWEAIGIPNRLRAICTKSGCTAVVRLSISRHGTITGDIIGKPGWPPSRCQGREMNIQELHDALVESGYRPGAWG